MTRITLCLTEKTLKSNQRQVETYRPYTDLLELRVDLLHTDQIPLINAWVESEPLPVILTCRREKDGGGFTVNQEEYRQKVLWDLMDAPFRYVDLEMDLIDPDWENKAKEKNITVIRSIHDFQGVPETLSSLFEQYVQQGKKEILKAAVTIEKAEDYRRFMSLLKQKKPENFVLLAMGSTGMFSRILAPQIGSCFCYTSSSAAKKQAAPGHLDPELLVKRYRFRQIHNDTPVMGIIGKPLGHSKSPEIHNQWLQEAEKEGVYVSFPLPDIKLVEDIKTLFHLRGLSVTIPYKVKVIDHTDETSNRVKTIGACNTLYRSEERWLGENTDAPGFLKPLLDRLNCSDLLGKKITVIGAGGAARGIVYALTEAGAELLILNRTVENAEKLAIEFKQKWGTLSEESNPLIDEYNDIIVQTTGVGMNPDISGDPLPFYSFKGRELLYDIIYNPEQTSIMKRAAEAGAKTLGGWDMLEEQARLQFKLFTR